MNIYQKKNKKYNTVKIILGILTLALLIYLFLNQNILSYYKENTFQKAGVIPLLVKNESLSNNILDNTCKKIIECQNILNEIM